jgi:hypothetical protein
MHMLEQGLLDQYCMLLGGRMRPSRPGRCNYICSSDMRIKWCHQPSASRILCVQCNKLNSNGNWLQYSLDDDISGFGYNLGEFL